MNWFMLIISILYVGAAATELYRKNLSMAVVYMAWALSNLMLGVK